MDLRSCVNLRKVVTDNTQKVLVVKGVVVEVIKCDKVEKVKIVEVVKEVVKIVEVIKEV